VREPARLRTTFVFLGNHCALIDFRLPVTCFRERARDRLKFRELQIHVRRAKILEDSFR
jgi:hypothetical protein